MLHIFPFQHLWTCQPALWKQFAFSLVRLTLILLQDVSSVILHSGDLSRPSPGLTDLSLCTPMSVPLRISTIELRLPVIPPTLTRLYPEDADHCCYCRRSIWCISGTKYDLGVLFIICIFVSHKHLSMYVGFETTSSRDVMVHEKWCWKGHTGYQIQVLVFARQALLLTEPSPPHITFIWYYKFPLSGPVPLCLFVAARWPFFLSRIILLQ